MLGVYNARCVYIYNARYTYIMLGAYMLGVYI
jgi:hypothetical protein